ncbi:MAG TPA: cellulosome anchor protein [Clostridium sp.]|nr:cellulosome anchor protein [Clostridium sp.]
MIKSSLIKIGIITVLLVSILCSCSTTGRESKTADPTASIEANKDNDASKEPVYSESPDIMETAKPDPSPDNTDVLNQTSEPTNNEELTGNLNAADIRIVLDRNTAKKGEIITAKIILNNIANIAGYQVNIKYDPNILQAVDLDSGEPLENKQMPSDGNILVNSDYNVLPLVANDDEKGLINFGKAYIDVDKYRESNKPESSGVLALIGFKVLKEDSTTVAFEDTPTMPNALSGTFFYDWNFEVLTNYSVGEGARLN